MQGQQKSQDGIFYPEDLKELEAQLRAGDRPGESNPEREDRAIRLIRLGRRTAKALPEELRGFHHKA